MLGDAISDSIISIQASDKSFTFLVKLFVGECSTKVVVRVKTLEQSKVCAAETQNKL